MIERNWLRLALSGADGVEQSVLLELGQLARIAKVDRLDPAIVDADGQLQTVEGEGALIGIVKRSGPDGQRDRVLGVAFVSYGNQRRFDYEMPD